jgi:hypothetical protein
VSKEVSQMGTAVFVYLYNMAEKSNRNSLHSFSASSSGMTGGGGSLPIWHSSVAVFGKEYSYGETGMSQRNLNAVDKSDKPIKYLVGYTSLGKKQLQMFLYTQNKKFSPRSYSVFENNCNKFSWTICDFLCKEFDFPTELKDQKVAAEVVEVGIVATVLVGLFSLVRSLFRSQ